MANELDTTRKTSNFKTKKLSSIIDFSALVSLSFLLIMFYMLTSAMSKPQTMELSLAGDYGCSESICCFKPDENRIITILLDSNNKIVYYQGLIYFPITTPKSVNYGQLGIRKELLIRKKLINDYCLAKGKPNDNMIVIIKPSKQSNYKNLVDILDEMAIVGVTNYAIINDLTPEEKQLLNNTILDI